MWAQNGYVDAYRIQVNYQYRIVTDSNVQQLLLSTSAQIEDYLGNHDYLVRIPQNEIKAVEKIVIREFTWKDKMSHYDWIRLSSTEFSYIHVFPFKDTGLPMPFFREQISSRRELDSILQLPFVKFVELPYETAVVEVYGALSNQRIHLLHHLPIPFKGNGIHILLDDDGPVGNHIDYKNRIHQQEVTATTPINDHADHLAGILVGAGNLNPFYKGIAEKASIYLYTYTSNISDTTGLFAIPRTYYQYETYITNTSQGNGCNAGYNAFAQILDQQVIDFPRLLHVFSAGNNGNVSCGYYAGNGFGTITGGSKLSKNTISVGNTIKNDVLNYNSSQGPATDGRIKPEVVATGVNVFSTSNYPNENEYDGMSGTSQASAVVAGTAALLYEAYKSLYDTIPYSDLIKNVLLNGAQDLGNKGPDFKFGFGKVNAWRSYELIKKQQFFIDTILLAATKHHFIEVPANVKQVKIMLYWHDVPSSLVASSNLVNDLHLSVVSPDATVYLPWVLNHFPDMDSLNAAAVRKLDTINNVEQVTIDSPTLGTYMIEVKSAFQTTTIQRYILSYDFVYDSLKVVFPNGGEKLQPTQNIRIYWDHFAENTTDYEIAYSSDKLNWQIISANISASQRWYDWEIPSNLAGNYWLKIKQGSLEAISDSSFSIYSAPLNLQVDTVCENRVVISWDVVPFADSYVVYQLGNMYMDSVGISTVPKFIFTSENIMDTAWYAVQAKFQNFTSERSTAEVRFPGQKNCETSVADWTKERLYVFPNPVQADDVTIFSENIIEEIILYDLHGRILWKEASNANNIQINVSGWANNVYLLKIRTSNQLTFTQKLIIHR